MDGLLVEKNIRLWNAFAYGNRSNFLKLYHCLSKRNTRNFLGKFVKADTNLLFLESFQKQTTYAENKTNKFRKKGFFQSKVTATNWEIGLAWKTRLCKDPLMFVSVFCEKKPCLKPQTFNTTRFPKLAQSFSFEKRTIFQQNLSAEGWKKRETTRY